MAGDRKTIGFKLSGDKLSELEAAAKKAGTSPGDFAKTAVLERLESNASVHKVAMKVATLEMEVSELRKDLALATQALLVAAGKLTDAEARTWVKENIKTG